MYPRELLMQNVHYENVYIIIVYDTNFTPLPLLN